MKVPRVRTQFTIAHDVLELLNQESERLSVSRSVIVDMLVRKYIKKDVKGEKD